MPRTLYAQLAWVLFLLLLAIGLTYATVSTYVLQGHLAKIDQTFNRNLARNLVAERNLVREGRLDYQALKDTFHEYMEINPSIEIYLINLSGELIAYSADPGKVVRQQVSLGPIRSFLGGAGNYPLLGDDPRSFEGQKIFSVTPVPSAEEIEGYLYVVLRGQLFDRVEEAFADSYYLRLGSWAVLISLGFGLFAGLVIFRVLTRRLRLLTGAMEQFRRSDFRSDLALPSPTNERPRDEIEALQRTFQLMSRRIVGQIAELRDQDNARRELVAHVSHDLRTPLASLSGYIETLQIKGDTLSAPERRRYLDIAGEQTARLASLVDDLFELAKLEATDAPPQVEPFSLSDLVQDVVQKFSLQAEGRRVRLDVDIPGCIPLAIAKRILDLHHSHISVRSEIRKGTTFSFDLPVHAS